MTEREDITVLCVDPDATAREATVAAFEGQDRFRPIGEATFESALETADGRDVDCVIAEYDLPDGNGFEVFEAIREQFPNVACILFTDAGHAEIDSAAFRQTVAEYIPKGAEGVHDRLVEVAYNAVANRTQVGFPLPPEEDERLDALAAYDVEDLATVDTFDRLAELVASHFDIRVAFVGLIREDEERFVACHGADWETLDREDSICTYAILDDDVTVIENVQDDRRFEHNETLKQLHIRSYAGANLTAPDGRVIGELCCIHDEPRSYSEAERADLRLFAAEISEQLELRRRLRRAGGTVQPDPEGQP